jgi:Ca-activated chloride channel family protein
VFRFGLDTALWGLLLVPLLAGAFWYAMLARRRALARFGDTPLMDRLSQTVNRRGRAARAVLVLVAVAALVVALARPQFGTRVDTVRREGQDLVVALDLSASMLAEDIAPNRLERAKLAVTRMIERLEGDRIGLVAFAGQAFVQSPLTVDYGAARLFLNAMEPDLVPVQGTNLGQALAVSLDSFDEDENREHRILLLFTDGEDHEGEVDANLERAVAAGVRIFTVGFGSGDGVPIPDLDEQGRRRGFLRDDDGAVVTTRLEEEPLQRLAEATGGRYIRVTPGGAELTALAEELTGMAGREIEAQQVTQFEEQFQLFLGLALILLLVEMLIPERRRVAVEWTGRFGVLPSMLLGLTLLLPSPAAAQAGRTEVREGNRLYQEGRFEDAHEKYLEALRAAPGSPVVRFNDGNALYQTDEFQRAVEAYQEAIEAGDPALESQAWYNAGNSFFRQQQLAEAIEAYKQALRADPGDVDAKHNLELALEQMEQQQQNQQQGGDQEQDQQQQDQDQNGEGDQQQDQQDQQDDQGDQPDDEDQEQEQDPGDQEQDQDDQGDQPPPQQAPPPPGQMTREQAEQLLRAIEEDPEQAGRQKAISPTGRRPRKKW